MVITFVLAQSDHIKRRTLYFNCKIVQYSQHKISMSKSTPEIGVKDNKNFDDLVHLKCSLIEKF